MKITKFGKYLWHRLNLITLDDDRRGWYYIPKEGIDFHENQLKRPGWPYANLSNKTKIIYANPIERVYVVKQPRIPMFATIRHQHGKHKSEIGEDFKCLRCGVEVPETIKSLVMMETLVGRK